MFTQNVGQDSLIGRTISWNEGTDVKSGKIASIERDNEGHNIIIDNGTATTDATQLFARDISLVTSAMQQVGRMINNQTIEEIRMINGNAHLVLEDGSTVQFTGQTTTAPNEN